MSSAKTVGELQSKKSDTSSAEAIPNSSLCRYYDSAFAKFEASIKKYESAMAALHEAQSQLISCIKNCTEESKQAAKERLAKCAIEAEETGAEASSAKKKLDRIEKALCLLGALEKDQHRARELDSFLRARTDL